MEKKKYNAPSIKVAVMEKLMQGDQTASGGGSSDGTLTSKPNSNLDSEESKSTSWVNDSENN